MKEQAKGVYNVPVPEMAGYFAPRDDAKSLYTSGKLIADILIKRGQIKAAPKIEDTFTPDLRRRPRRNSLSPRDDKRARPSAFGGRASWHANFEQTGE